MLRGAVWMTVRTLGILSTSFGGVVSWLLQRLNHEGTKGTKKSAFLRWGLGWIGFNHRGTEDTESRVRRADQIVAEELLVLLIESS